MLRFRDWYHWYCTCLTSGSVKKEPIASGATQDQVDPLVLQVIWTSFELRDCSVFTKYYLGQEKKFLVPISGDPFFEGIKKRSSRIQKQLKKSFSRWLNFFSTINIKEVMAH